MIFQDSYMSLDLRLAVGDLIGEALDIHRLSLNSPPSTLNYSYGCSAS